MINFPVGISTTISGAVGGLVLGVVGSILAVPLLATQSGSPRPISQSAKTLAARKRALNLTFAGLAILVGLSVVARGTMPLFAA